MKQLLMLLLFLFALLPTCFADEKPLVGVVMVIDETPPLKNDLHVLEKPKDYTISQFNQEYRLLDGCKYALREKYSTHSIILEMGEDINTLFKDYLTSDTGLVELAKANKYAYLMIVTQNINYIERFNWDNATVKGNCNIRILDIKNNKTIFSETFTEEGTARIPQNAAESLYVAAQHFTNNLAIHIQKELPLLPVN
jgi:hypothetical protein